MFKEVLVPVVTVGEPECVASRGGFLGWFVHVQQLELFRGVKRDLEPSLDQLDAGHDGVDVVADDSDVAGLVVVDLDHHGLDSDETAAVCQVDVAHSLTVVVDYMLPGDHFVLDSDALLPVGNFF